MADWTKEDEDGNSDEDLSWMGDQFQHTTFLCPCGVYYVFKRCIDPNCPVWVHTYATHRELIPNEP